MCLLLCLYNGMMVLGPFMATIPKSSWKGNWKGSAINPHQFLSVSFPTLSPSYEHVSKILYQVHQVEEGLNQSPRFVKSSHCPMLKPRCCTPKLALSFLKAFLTRILKKIQAYASTIGFFSIKLKGKLLKKSKQIKYNCFDKIEGKTSFLRFTSFDWTSSLFRCKLGLHPSMGPWPLTRWL